MCDGWYDTTLFFYTALDTFFNQIVNDNKKPALKSCVLFLLSMSKLVYKFGFPSLLNDFDTSKAKYFFLVSANRWRHSFFWLFRAQPQPRCQRISVVNPTYNSASSLENGRQRYNHRMCSLQDK